ncbi:MAG: T9SS type A sorting domain-containing protein [Chitinophagales bacterium]
MLKILLSTLLLTTVIVTSAQLPPVAQELYDEAYAQDSLMVQYAINNGAEILPTPDGYSFYIKWFPAGASVNNTPLIVSLHGSDGYAFHEFYSWHQRAELKGCGIIALQWFRGHSSATPNTYFTDDTIYNYLDAALSAISYPSDKAMYHGFSRGSARSYAIVLKDIQGKNYFCTIMSNSGGMDSSYPFYQQINANIFGTQPYTGKKWNLFCGGQDPNPYESGCPAMEATKSWLESRGATVDVFIQDAGLGHNGFQLQSSSAYKDSVLEDYLKCFNAPAYTPNLAKLQNLIVYPNPANSQLNIQLSGNIDNADLCIYNSMGSLVKTASHLSGSSITLNIANLKTGIYHCRLIAEGKTLGCCRFTAIN